jgi:hypothetical protein
LPDTPLPPARRDRAGSAPEADWAYDGNSQLERQSSQWSGGPAFADTSWPQREPGYDLPQRSGSGFSRAPRSRGRRAAGGPQSRRSKGVLVAVGLVGVALAVVVAAVTLHFGGGSAGGGHPTPGPSTPLTSATVLTPVGASGFDPLASVKADPGNEESLYAKFAIDDNPQTAWTSQWYATPDFGHLKAGSGMLIDMGRAVRYSSVTITFDSQPGANVKLLTGNSSARSKQNLLSMKELAAKNNVVGTVTFTITSSATGRYLAIWFTRLPPQPGAPGKYEARIYNVVVRGTPAAG